jgi:toxin CptA
MPVQRVAISPSSRLAVATCVVHVAAAVMVWLASFPLWLTAVTTLAIATSLVWTLWRTAALRAAQAIIALEIVEDGRLSIQTRRGEWLECELLGSSYVSPRLTILNLKPRGSGRTRHIVLVPDNVDEHDFRRLRTWLRWGVHN